MNDVFQSIERYRKYIFNIAHNFSSIQRSTLTLYGLGPYASYLKGDLFFSNSFRLSIEEGLGHAETPIVITGYSYEGRRDNEKLYWYDPQPHPHIPHLQVSHPHHKHVPPNIKRNRIPALNIRFDQPNLPFLIREIETVIALSTR